MTDISGKKLLVELLLQEGITTIFGNPGTTELVLMDELAQDDRIRYVLGLQESVVLGMADGYAQASGNVAMVNLHAAPGLGNAMGMLYNAKRTGTPLLVTAGQQDLSFAQTEPVLWDDLVSMARPLVKWSAEVQRLADLPQAVHRAVKIALTPPTGPVFLSIPGDVLLEEGPVRIGAPTRVAPRIRGDLEAIRAAAKMLSQSSKPLLIAGDIITQGDALDEMVRLAETLGAPVVLEGAQNTATFPASHPLFMGTLGRLGPALRASLDEFDTLFSVGGDLFTLSLPSPVEIIPDHLKIIHLDNDPWQLGKNIPTDIAILGDAKATIPDLIDAFDALQTEASRAVIAARREDSARRNAQSRAKLTANAQAEAEKHPIRPVSLMEELGELLGEDTVIVEETLSSRGRMREQFQSNDIRSFYGMRGGGIGWGLPGAVGIKLAQPERPVVALVGDGSSIFTNQSLWTAVNQRLGGLVFVILNNSSYRILKQRTRDMGGVAASNNKFLAMDLDDPRVDFQALAKTFGMESLQVDTLDALKTEITKALKSRGPVLIEVAIERSI